MLCEKPSGKRRRPSRRQRRVRRRLPFPLPLLPPKRRRLRLQPRRRNRPTHCLETTRRRVEVYSARSQLQSRRLPPQQRRRPRLQLSLRPIPTSALPRSPLSSVATTTPTTASSQGRSPPQTLSPLPHQPRPRRLPLSSPPLHLLLPLLTPPPPPPPPHLPPSPLCVASSLSIPPC